MKKHTQRESGVQAAREALVWLRITNGGVVELPKALPVIRF